MGVLGHNGALVWTSITGGKKETEVPSDKINIEWVLGNKLLLGSVNANREYFESGIKDMALGEVMYPGVLQKILTNPVNGLDNYQEMMRLLVEDNSALKVYVNVPTSERCEPDGPEFHEWDMFMLVPHRFADYFTHKLILVSTALLMALAGCRAAKQPEAALPPELAFSEQLERVQTGGSDEIRLERFAVSSAELTQLAGLANLRALVLDAGIVRDSDVKHIWRPSLG